MTFSLSYVDWYVAGGTWGQSAGYSEPNANEIAYISNLLTQIAGTPSGAALLMGYSATDKLRIALGSTDRFDGFSNGSEVVVLNLLDEDYALNASGEWFFVPDVLVLAHELAHVAGPGWQLDPAPNGETWLLNQAGFDYDGPAIRGQNSVAVELGLPEQISYNSGISVLELLQQGLSVGQSYSNGAGIDAVRYSKTIGEVIDTSGGPNGNVASRDLVFGLAGSNEISTGAGADHIWGGHGDDTADGGDENDRLMGEIGADSLAGGAGDDVLIGGGVSGLSASLEDGNDTLSGGDGAEDLAVFSGPCKDYDFSDANGVWTITHARGDAVDGTDNLTGVEFVKFEDKIYKLETGRVPCGGTDLALVIDTTDSMSDDIASVKAQAAALVEALFSGEHADHCRVAILGFKDPGETSVLLAFTDHPTVEERKAAALSVLAGMSVSGGGDEPEGVYSALKEALTGAAGEWREEASVRRVVLFGDAPPKDGELAAEVEALAKDVLGDSSALAEEPWENPGATISTVAVGLGAVGIGLDPTASFREIADRNGGVAYQDFDIMPDIDALIEAATSPYLVPLDGTGLSEVLTGTLADDRLSGREGSDTLVAREGDDVLDGGAGTDVLQGGKGNDLYFADDASDAVVELGDEGVDEVRAFITFTLPDFVENGRLLGVSDIHLVGNADDNSLFGNFGDNSISGHAGNDTISGGFGYDVLSGGDGDDVIIPGWSDDVVTGGSGNDVFVFETRIEQNVDTVTDFVRSDDFLDFTLLPYQTFTLSQSGADAIFHFPNNYRIIVQNTVAAELIAGVHYGERYNSIIGTSAGEQLLGSAGPDRIEGLGGNDTLSGLAGHDMLSGGTGDDTYYISDPDQIIELAGEGVDTVVTSITFTLADNVEYLTLTGQAFGGYGNSLANIILGNSTSNRLEGGDGIDYIAGLGGEDTLVGGNGDDWFHIDDQGDVIIEASGEGWDNVNGFVSYTLPNNVEHIYLRGTAAIDATGNSTSNDIQGNVAANVLHGLGGSDILTGWEGGDTLDGGDGNDWLRGKSDNDVLAGGAGDDRFSFGPGDGGDSILDFVAGGAEDWLDFSEFGGASFTLSQSGPDAVFTFSSGETLTLVGVAVSNLVEGVDYENGGGGSSLMSEAEDPSYAEGRNPPAWGSAKTTRDAPRDHVAPAFEADPRTFSSAGLSHYEIAWYAKKIENWYDFDDAFVAARADALSGMIDGLAIPVPMLAQLGGHDRWVAG